MQRDINMSCVLFLFVLAVPSLRAKVEKQYAAAMLFSWAALTAGLLVKIVTLVTANVERLAYSNLFSFSCSLVVVSQARKIRFFFVFF